MHVRIYIYFLRPVFLFSCHVRKFWKLSLVTEICVSLGSNQRWAIFFKSSSKMHHKRRGVSLREFSSAKGLPKMLILFFSLSCFKSGDSWHYLGCIFWSSWKMLWNVPWEMLKNSLNWINIKRWMLSGRWSKEKNVIFICTFLIYGRLISNNLQNLKTVYISWSTLSVYLCACTHSCVWNALHRYPSSNKTLFAYKKIWWIPQRPGSYSFASVEDETASCSSFFPGLCSVWE